MRPILSEALQVDNLEITIPDLPPSLEGITIAQLSDLHYDGLRLSEELLEEAIAATNEAKPDIIFLTGDYVTDDPSPIHPLAQRLKYLHSSLGIYAALGNHDHLYIPGSREEITQALTKIDIHVLWNQIACPFGTEMPVVGLADFWSKEFKGAKAVMEQLDPTIPRIVLSHNPDSAIFLKQWRVDLQLSGHTHGGQITLPDGQPLPLFVSNLRSSVPRLFHPLIPFLRQCSNVVDHWEWAKGLHQVGDNQLYINRGLGTYFPGRYSCPPEVSIIRLTRSPQT
jgi:predicted MPP superfamily phosphohydrolase